MFLEFSAGVGCHPPSPPALPPTSLFMEDSGPWLAATGQKCYPLEQFMLMVLPSPIAMAVLENDDWRMSHLCPGDWAPGHKVSTWNEHFKSILMGIKPKWGLPWWSHPMFKNPPCNTPDQSLVWEVPTCCEATKAMSCNYWANVPRTCALQQEKSLLREAQAPRGRVVLTHQS